MGSDLCKSLVQPPAQDSINYRVSSGCSGFYQSSPENLQGWRL